MSPGKGNDCYTRHIFWGFGLSAGKELIVKIFLLERSKWSITCEDFLRRSMSFIEEDFIIHNFCLLSCFKRQQRKIFVLSHKNKLFFSFKCGGPHVTVHYKSALHVEVFFTIAGDYTIFQWTEMGQLRDGFNFFTFLL